MALLRSPSEVMHWVTGMARIHWNRVNFPVSQEQGHSALQLWNAPSGITAKPLRCRQRYCSLWERGRDVPKGIAMMATVSVYCMNFCIV